ncbi:hypothetical protein G6F46_006917 [Rhizopus delemar]|uniref:Uncharacterized protein n=2 Tax=Rhizopus TaxID=4842 RepID=A0A9P7CNZ4_9FUNG|nr:hypothetical protein G6F55_005618 [Rhizopus delemar]KAG1542819.1 hypothetical protein G6F51_007051 [Rhizopus arrhizus]KAG1502441.1 hypothetical protein G6F54_002358 [Rhizopus delemar]KAG1510515.1 hypothetical protein G6F53_006631 [Rhizopus delemar]KAG1527049.1 hypothetical protein G6F52_001887 [Rhizopus delemar]
MTNGKDSIVENGKGNEENEEEEDEDHEPEDSDDTNQSESYLTNDEINVSDSKVNQLTQETNSDLTLFGTESAGHNSYLPEGHIPPPLTERL